MKLFFKYIQFVNLQFVIHHSFEGFQIRASACQVLHGGACLLVAFSVPMETRSHDHNDSGKDIHYDDGLGAYAYQSFELFRYSFRRLELNLLAAIV